MIDLCVAFENQLKFLIFCIIIVVVQQLVDKECCWMSEGKKIAIPNRNWISNLVDFLLSEIIAFQLVNK